MHPDRIAVYQKKKQYTYSDLATMVDKIASLLHSVPVFKGDRILISFSNVLEFISAYLAVLKTGCIPVLANMDARPEKLNFIIQDVGAVGLICHSWVFRRLKNHAGCLKFVFTAPPFPDSSSDILIHSSPDKPHFPLDLHTDFISPQNQNVSHLSLSNLSLSNLSGQTIIFTSGTTGIPKGVILSDENLMHSAGIIIDRLKLTPDDRVLITMPFSLCAGLLHVLAHLLVGAGIVTGENTMFFGSLLSAVHSQRVTGMPAVPSFIQSVLSRYKKEFLRYCARLRYIELSSQPSDKSLIQTLLETLPNASIYNTYGLTEAPRATYNHVSEHRHVCLSVGAANKDIHIQILDDQGNLCRAGEIGEIYISGPTLAKGYWNRPEKTKAAFTRHGFKTGDLGYKNADGKIYLKCRKNYWK